MQPPGGDRDWRRLEHSEQIDAIKAASAPREPAPDVPEDIKLRKRAAAVARMVVQAIENANADFACDADREEAECLVRGAIMAFREPAPDVQALTGQSQPEKVGSFRPTPNTADLEFGHGALIVDTGEFRGKPAVYVMPAKVPGEVGKKPTENYPKDALIAGEVVWTFPTREQAERVAEALLNLAPNAPDMQALTKRIEALKEGMRLVLMFYKNSRTSEDSVEWQRITGANNFTTRGLCDHIRALLTDQGDTP